MGDALASFSNSRIKPRPATSQSQTVISNVLPVTTKLAIPANENRTAINLRNLDSSLSIWYGYVNTIDGITSGFELKPLDVVPIDDPGDIYIRNNDAVATISYCFDEGEG